VGPYRENPRRGIGPRFFNLTQKPLFSNPQPPSLIGPLKLGEKKQSFPRPEFPPEFPDRSRSPNLAVGNLLPANRGLTGPPLMPKWLGRALYWVKPTWALPTPNHITAATPEVPLWEAYGNLWFGFRRCMGRRYGRYLLPSRNFTKYHCGHSLCVVYYRQIRGPKT